MKKRVIWLLAALVALLCVLMVSASAAETVGSGRCGDNLTWAVTDDGVLTISGTGDMWDYFHGDPTEFDSVCPGWCRTRGWQIYDTIDTITSIVIEEGVTSIGEQAFTECPANYDPMLEMYLYSTFSQSGVSVTIPRTVTHIGSYAFGGMWGYDLTYVNDVYYGGTPEEWSQIDIQDDRLRNCEGIHYAKIEGTCGDDLTWTMDSTGTLVIDGTGEMSNYQSYGSSISPWLSYSYDLRSVIIGDSVTSIGKYAFFDCSSLTSVVIPDSVTSIESYAFYSCSKLTDVYYTGTEEEWKQIKINSYNTPLTNATVHCNYSPAPSVETEVSLESGATPEFIIDTTTITGTDNYAVITMADETQRVEQSEWVDGTIVYDGVAMKDLTQTVTMGLFDAAGNLLTEQSVCVYDAMKARLDAETNVQKKAEYTAQLHLAAAAQKYFDHNVGNLANKDLDGTVGDMSEHRKDESSLSGKNKDIIYGTSCVLGAQLQMKIYFTANDKDVFINGEKVELTASPTEGYYFYRMNVDPADIFESVSIEVKDGDTVLATAKDSVASYCARLYAMDGEKNETLADALLNYGVAARAAEV